MTFLQQLRQQHDALWQRVVTHPFVIELGEGTLPVTKFRAYFLQDYVFVHDLVTMTALGLAKAPTFRDANMLNQFLSDILTPENDLFLRAFAELGVSAQEATAVTACRVTQAFGDFLIRTSLEGSFADIVTALYVTEGTYLDWGSRLLQAGKQPQQAIYREWITIHGPQVLGTLVAWLAQHLESMEPAGQRLRSERIFRTALRYEYLFWEEAYRGSVPWPDQDA